MGCRFHMDDGMLEAGAIALAQAESMGGFIPGFNKFHTKKSSSLSHQAMRLLCAYAVKKFILLL